MRAAAPTEALSSTAPGGQGIQQRRLEETKQNQEET